MTQKFKQQWIDALRSGQYPQGRKYLYDNGKYCCLGVGAVVAGIPLESIEGERVIDYDLDVLVRLLVPDELIGHAIPSNELVKTLTEMNDSGNTFEEIADYIELTVETETCVMVFNTSK